MTDVEVYIQPISILIHVYVHVSVYKAKRGKSLLVPPFTWSCDSASDRCKIHHQRLFLPKVPYPLVYPGPALIGNPHVEVEHNARRRTLNVSDVQIPVDLSAGIGHFSVGKYEVGV